MSSSESAAAKVGSRNGRAQLPYGTATFRLTRLVAAAFLAAYATFSGALAQTPEVAVEEAPLSGVLVLNQERLIANTILGRRIQSEIEEALALLAAQNREIEADLTEEELELAELRSTMETAEFRVLADEFDARVEAIREAQETKARDLTVQAEQARAQFFERAAPVLLEIVRERGAAVLMDNRAVLLAAESVDITEDAIAALDANLGDGGPEPIIDVDLQLLQVAPE